MQYRPANMAMLCGAVSILQKQRQRERYLGDLIWLTAKAQYKSFSLMPYSDYAEFVETGKMPPDPNKQIRQKVENMLNMFD